jgi:hypothetical protein
MYPSRVTPPRASPFILRSVTVGTAKAVPKLNVRLRRIEIRAVRKKDIVWIL